MTDQFHRVVTLDSDAVRIRDVAYCRLPCFCIAIQESCRNSNAGAHTPDVTQTHRRPPIFIEGARRRSIERTYRDGRLTDCQVGRSD